MYEHLVLELCNNVYIVRRGEQFPLYRYRCQICGKAGECKESGYYAIKALRLHLRMHY